MPKAAWLRSAFGSGTEETPDPSLLHLHSTNAIQDSTVLIRAASYNQGSTVGQHEDPDELASAEHRHLFCCEQVVEGGWAGGHWHGALELQREPGERGPAVDSDTCLCYTIGTAFYLRSHCLHLRLSLPLLACVTAFVSDVTAVTCVCHCMYLCLSPPLVVTAFSCVCHCLCV